MDRRRASQTALAVLLLALTSGGAKCGRPKDGVEGLRRASRGLSDRPAVENMGKKLERRPTGGSASRCIASMQLGGEKEAIEQAQVGASSSRGSASGRSGRSSTISTSSTCPFSSATPSTCEKVIDGPIGQELLDKVTDNPNRG